MSRRRNASSAGVEPVRGLIFDLDGTLVDTLEEITATLSSALRRAGLPAASRASVRGWVGDGPVRLVEKALPAESQTVRDKVLASLENGFRDRPLGRSRPYPGIEDLLDRLSAIGTPMAVLSNKLHQAAVHMVEALFAPSIFAATRGYRIASERKPDPAGALDLVRVLALPRQSVAIVGDTAVDIETARRAGLRSIAVTWGFRDRAELEAAGPTWLAGEASEIWDLVRGGADDTITDE